MDKTKILVTRAALPAFEEYVEEIKEIWESHRLTNMGNKHGQFEAELMKYLKLSNVILFTNGHLALESAIEAYNLSGEVITTPFTFASTTHAIVRNGLKPVFCDVNSSNCTIDTEQLESLITDKTTAIVPVHVYGSICNINEIDRIAKKYNLKVIYDAAHAFGVTVNKVGIGCFGDASVFSFHATKVFQSIEGGAVSFQDFNMRRILNCLKNFGITGEETVEIIGGNAKMSEFQAAMGLCNLRHIDNEILGRKAVVERYLDHLSGIRGIKLIPSQNGVESNYAYLPVFFDGYAKSRDYIYELLKKNDVYARKYFYPITSNFDCYSKTLNPGNTPIAKYMSERVLTLPLYADLQLNDVDRICRLIKKY